MRAGLVDGDDAVDFFGRLAGRYMHPLAVLSDKLTNAQAVDLVLQVQGYGLGRTKCRALELKASRHADEYAVSDFDTGTMEWGRGPHGQAKEDYYNCLMELAEEIRGLAATTPKPDCEVNIAPKDCLWARNGNTVCQSQPATGAAAQAEPVAELPEDDRYPYYELRFIMRVLGHKGRAPEADWATAYGMAREIYIKWSKDRTTPPHVNEGQATPDEEPMDGMRIVHAGFELHGYRQGTNECIAFNRGVRFCERETVAPSPDVSAVKGRS